MGALDAPSECRRGASTGSAWCERVAPLVPKRCINASVQQQHAKAHTIAHALHPSAPAHGPPGSDTDALPRPNRIEPDRTASGVDAACERLKELSSGEAPPPGDWSGGERGDASGLAPVGHAAIGSVPRGDAPEGRRVSSAPGASARMRLAFPCRNHAALYPCWTSFGSFLHAGGSAMPICGFDAAVVRTAEFRTIKARELTCQCLQCSATWRWGPQAADASSARGIDC